MREKTTTTEQYLEILKLKMELLMKKKPCKICLDVMKKVKNSENFIKCGKRICRKKKSTANIFENKPFAFSTLKFIKIIEILKIFFMELKIKQIETLTGISRQSIKSIINESLKLIKKFVKKNKKMLGGNNIIVECDESLFGKRKYNRGRLRKQTWVVGFVEKTDERKVFFCTVKKRNKITLNNLINKVVENRSTLHTDCWKGYSQASLYVQKHHTVNHSIGFINLANMVHTNTIEGTWTSLKSFIPKRNRNRKHLSNWLHFFMFKRNYKGDILKNFINILQ